MTDLRERTVFGSSLDPILCLSLSLFFSYGSSRGVEVRGTKLRKRPSMRLYIGSVTAGIYCRKSPRSPALTAEFEEQGEGLQSSRTLS